MCLNKWWLLLGLLLPALGCSEPRESSGREPQSVEQGATASHLSESEAPEDSGDREVDSGQTQSGEQPTVLQSYSQSEGTSIYQYYCSPCHGNQGLGDGFNAYNLDPRPRNLAEPEFQARMSDQEIREAISLGGRAVGRSVGMPPWGKTLNERQIENLVKFVRTLPQSTEE